MKVNITIQMDPTHAVSIPAFSAFLEGKEVRKSQSIRLRPS